MTSRPVYVVGASAVGLVLAAQLSRVAAVTLVVRKRRLDVVRNGFTIDGAGAGRYVLPVIELGTPLPAHADVVVAFRAPFLAQALTALQLGPRHSVLVCSPGIGVAALTRLHCLEVARVRAACWFDLGLKASDHVQVKNLARMTLAADEPAGLHALDRWQAMLEATGLVVHSEPKVAACEWRRALQSIVFDGLCICMGDTYGSVVASPPLQALASQLWHEARAVAAAEGVTMQADALAQLFAIARQMPEFAGSMVQDLALGQKTEMPFFNLAVARLAAKHGLFAPTNAVIARLVEHREHHRRARPTGQSAS